MAGGGTAKKTTKVRASVLRQIINTAPSAKRWEVIYLLSGPFLFAFVFLLPWMGVPRLLRGYLFLLLPPYIGLSFILIDTIRRRYSRALMIKARLSQKEREAAKEQIRADRLARRDQRTAALQERKMAQELGSQKAELAALGKTRSPHAEAMADGTAQMDALRSKDAQAKSDPKA